MGPGDSGVSPSAAEPAAVARPTADAAATEPGPIDSESTGADPVSAAAPHEPGVTDLARDAIAFGRAWLNLVAGEAALAKINLFRLLLGALLILAVAIGLIASIDAVAAVLLFVLCGNWLIAVVSTAILNVVLLVVLLWLVRSWWRTLSLPQSRQALSRLWRSHVTSPNGKTADPGGQR